MEQRKKMKHMQMQPSNSRRKTTPENHIPLAKKPIGCMSGILHLLSRHHSRRRISSAARKEKIEIPLSKPISPQPDLNNINSTESKGLSQRSPTLPLEIRRSGCFDNGESPRPALVARLMGLEEAVPPPAAAAAAAGGSPESAEEKRRKLLGALERCDEDLRALKRIIDAVRFAEMIGVNDVRDLSMEGVKGLDGNGEQPSPVSVLDGLSSPGNEDMGKKTRISLDLNCHLHRRIKIEEIRRPPSYHKRLSKDQSRPVNSSLAAVTKAGGGRWRWRRSNAMVESVGEVAEEAVCEERREAVRVGVDLADDVVGDIVGQLVMELVESCSKLCFQTLRCKRKLSF